MSNLERVLKMKSSWMMSFRLWRVWAVEILTLVKSEAPASNETPSSFTWDPSSLYKHRAAVRTHLDKETNDKFCVSSFKSRKTGESSWLNC